MNIWHDLQRELDARAANNLARQLKRAPDNALDLASNDYLGLATHPRVIAAAREAAARYGAGARASRLVSGNFALLDELEEALARFKSCEAALVFSSGYAANIGVITALGDADSALFCHKRNHASLIDACALAQGKTRFFDSSEKLRSLLENAEATRKIIVCDGVFSMDGDLCDLPALVKLAREFDALIVLDDAHGTGTLGATGRGTVEHFGVVKQRGAGLTPSSNLDAVEKTEDWKRASAPLSATRIIRHRGHAARLGAASAPLSATRIITVGTLSKSLGSQGGFVCGPRVLIDYLVGSARSLVYSTGLNPPAVGAAIQALRIIESEPERIAKCRDNAAFLARALGESGWEVAHYGSPIVPVFAADSAEALRVSARLLERNLWCPAIRPPTVKRARLRLTSNASWDDATLERIVVGFAAALNQT